jgi:hypothetical protein
MKQRVAERTGKPVGAEDALIRVAIADGREPNESQVVKNSLGPCRCCIVCPNPRRTSPQKPLIRFRATAV